MRHDSTVLELKYHELAELGLLPRGSSLIVISYSCTELFDAIFGEVRLCGMCVTVVFDETDESSQ